MSAVTRIGGCLVATATLLLVMAGIASAHAYPITTSPAIGGLVKTSPNTVSITYDESITVPALAVYDAAGKRVSATTVSQPKPPTIAVAIPSKLPNGTYTVAWRVTSADTHVVHGVFTFSVGARGRTGSIGAQLLASEQIPGGILLGFGIVRFFNLALLLLCGGGAITLLWVLGDVSEAVRRLLLGALTAAGAALAIVAVLGLPFQAAEANGTGLGGGFSRLALAAVRHQHFGEIWLIRAWLAAAFALLALSLQIVTRRGRRAREALLAIAGVGLLMTSTDSGHASVTGPVAFLADAVHITSAAIWLGGLAFLLAALLAAGATDRWSLAARTVPRFSLIAVITVPLLGAAGIVSAYLEVRAWSGFWNTTYGNLVLVKIGLALPLLALGAFNNRVVVPALRTGAATPALRGRFLRALGLELTLLAAIVGVTAALVDEPPAKSFIKPSVPITATSFTGTGKAGPFKVVVTVKPAQAGVNTVSLRVTSGARHLKIGEVDLAAVPTAGARRPVNLAVIQSSPSGFRVKRAVLSHAGRWQFEITVRYNLTEYLARVPVKIGARP
jgi:copper transport protein